MSQRLGRLIAVIAISVATGVSPAFAQGAKGTTKGEDPKQRERDKTKTERDAQRYEKLKAFATTLLQTDPDFREEVDDHFDQVQRDHSIQAFEKNVAPPARPTVVSDGDRLRLQTGLYDNKVVADYINRVGQRLVPPDSDKLFAFRLVAYPIPFAETLSTGTIYISTGLVSLIDNEAQLAYVLAHEMAHVQMDHWRLKSVLALAQDDFIKKEGAKRRWLGIGIGAVVGVATGGILGSTRSAVELGLVGGAMGGAVASAWGKALVLDWDTVQENEADAFAFKATLARNYDVREVRALYDNLQGAVRRDQRVGLGFMGSKRRTAERLANVNDMIGQTFKAEIDERLPKFTITHPDFVALMATLKRDNGILSLYHDMFYLAKTNLEYARLNRPNDPAAHYYYGKVMKLVGRTDEDRRIADEAFQRAIDFDHRERNYGAHFYRALALINRKDSALNAEIAQELQTYLMASIRFSSEEASFANALPANLDDMYDYLIEVGDVTWRPILPDTLKPAMAQVGMETQKPTSPLAKPATTIAPLKTPPSPKGLPLPIKKP